jgi:hypothetical protein
MLTSSAPITRLQAPLDSVDDYRGLSDPEWTEWKGTEGEAAKKLTRDYTYTITQTQELIVPGVENEVGRLSPK